MTVNCENLFRLRLVVGRVGEMDRARWWNTQGQLSTLGSDVLQRGFRRTHHFAQARSVFAIAGHRCRDVYNPPSSVTLWSLPADVEDEFELRWEQWLDDADRWTPFFKDLEGCSDDLVSELRRRELVTDNQIERVTGFRRSAEQRAVQVAAEFDGTSDDIAMLALAFSRGEVGKLAVPYQRWSGGV